MRKTKQCKACKEEIDAKAIKCPHCQAKQTAGCAKIFLLIFLGFIFLCFISVCISKTDNGDSSVSTSSGTGAASEQGTAVIKYGWKYSESKDDFDGKETKICIIHSNDGIKVGFGTEKPVFKVRQRNKKEIDIIVHADGAVFGHPEGDNKVRVKFDDEEPFKVGFDGAADSSSDTIFLRSTSKIISKLKTAKKLTLELPVFMESGQRASFDIEGYNEVCKF
ncbi:MAG: hypothetical protein J6A01_09080 [Proteobacteria bacterium]|nr:hypothetical protein [Pseudomonadota bacterium]